MDSATSISYATRKVSPFDSALRLIIFANNVLVNVFNVFINYFYHKKRDNVLYSCDKRFYTYDSYVSC